MGMRTNVGDEDCYFARFDDPITRVGCRGYDFSSILVQDWCSFGCLLTLVGFSKIMCISNNGDEFLLVCKKLSISLGSPDLDVGFSLISDM
uniref:Uncharacterized protein n=1 Tax=Tanacetum cinerariifolium TaxID=118510 RepID=A0A6L2M8E6_TANCI|nr:hypothetical protein [Tanacetum cinerariifolium]